MEKKIKRKPRSLQLWHGTSSLDPKLVYTGDGLNINYANAGLWGKGIYFAVNANYSCPSYSFKSNSTNGKNEYKVFLANVHIGSFCNKDKNTDRELKEPPPLPPD